MVVNNFKNRRKQNINVRRYRSPQLFSGEKIAKKKNPPPKWIFVASFYFILLTCLSYFFFFSPNFRITDVMIEGNHLLTTDQIKSQIPLGDNIFRFNIDKEKADMADQFPEIDNVDIYRGIPNAIKVVISEKTPELVWQSGTKSYLISNQGDVMREIVGDEGNTLPKVTDTKALPVLPGTKLVSPSFIAFITNVYNTVYSVDNIKPVDFEIDETTFDVILHTDAGFYVKLNSMRSSKKQLDDLKTILVAQKANIHQYVDLRINGWAYYQ